MHGKNQHYKAQVLNKVAMEKISIAVKEITLANDRMTFIEQMISLSKLLMAHDLHISSAYKGIDEKARSDLFRG